MARDDKRSADFWIGVLRERVAELDSSRPDESLDLLKMIFGHGQSLKPYLKRLRDGDQSG